MLLNSIYLSSRNSEGDKVNFWEIDWILPFGCDPDKSVTLGIVCLSLAEVNGGSVLLGGHNSVINVKSLFGGIVDLEGSQHIILVDDLAISSGGNSEGDGSTNWLSIGESVHVLLSGDVERDSIIVEVSAGSGTVLGIA